MSSESERVINELLWRLSAEPLPGATVAEALRLLPRHAAPAPETLAEMAEESGLFFLDRASARLTPRPAFFQGACFLVSPTPYEVAEGILLPGHRFAPFCASCVFPSETRLCRDGAPVRLRRVSLPLNAFYRYYAHFGAEEMVDILAAEDDANAAAVHSGDPSRHVALQAFDMASFYRGAAFATGDRLRVQVVDWADGVFELAAQSAPARLGVASARPWIRRLEAALNAVFDGLGVSAGVPEQLAHAFHAEPSLLADPPISVEEFLSLSEEVRLAFVDDATILWRASEDPPSEGGMDGVSASSGAMDGLDEMLEELECPYSSIEIEAIFRHALSTGGEDFLEALQGHLDPDRLPYADEAQRAAFANALDELWEELAESAPRDSPELADLRADALDAFLAVLDAAAPGGAAEFSGEEVVRMLADLRGVLEALNEASAADGALDEPDARRLAEAVAAIVRQLPPMD